MQDVATFLMNCMEFCTRSKSSDVWPLPWSNVWAWVTAGWVCPTDFDLISAQAKASEGWKNQLFEMSHQKNLAISQRFWSIMPSKLSIKEKSTFWRCVASTWCLLCDEADDNDMMMMRMMHENPIDLVGNCWYCGTHHLLPSFRLIVE